MLISVDQLEESENRYAALETEPVRENVPDVFNEEVFIKGVSPDIIQGNILSTEENLTQRKIMLATVKQEPLDFAFERAIGKNDSLYSNFVELIKDAKQKVGRIAIKQGNKNIAFATGFMVSKNLMLTNWHVFKTIEDAGDSEVQFFYELDILGNPGTPVSFEINAEIFFHSNKELDYCLVAISPSDISGKVNLDDIGYIFLDPALGKLGNEEEEALNIIHHPDGDFMQLSIRENLFVKITPISIWYKTDTAPGSSGSPVFNDQWQVVALHHMGVGRKNEAGDYVDRDGKIIPMINGKIDASKVVWDANEGIRISVIIKDVFSKFTDSQIINGLQIKPPIKALSSFRKQNFEKIATLPNNPNNSSMETNNIAGNINISFPASLVEKNGGINININVQGHEYAVKQAQKLSVSTDEELDFEEIKKLEDSIDFSGCKGYQSRFLGTVFDIALPQPQKDLKKFIAKVGGTDSFILKYFNYSTIFHSVRMMPVISAINVDGNPAKRQDKTARIDVWLRDKRLSFDIQLSDSYYKGSGFDRGHMSRREDANWGATPEEAKRNADLTCMYTNACPQVPKINQGGKKGLWGILEQVVLENGAEIEKGKTAKISVFNGPVFKDADPVFRGIQVPMDFYKIVLWLTGNGHLKATAFKLSQLKLVNDIDFEQLDIDQNTQFKAFQCSIKSLHEQTNMDFSGLFQFDTFEGAVGEELALNSEIELVSHLEKHNND
ncbi:MAG: DNA/RNA non-specific endonuclease [Segetibacter sp.]